MTSLLLAGHSTGVKAIDAKYVNGQLLVATSAADATLKLWRVSVDSAECFQSIDFSGDLCFAVRICNLGNDALFAVASGDKVVLYKRATDGNSFECTQTLVGHEDWVRGLDFIRHGDEYLLASSSQDSFIRVWKTSSDSTKQFVLESVLSGHDNWVYSVQWALSESGSLQLLSCSMDKTMILWELRDAIWTERVRVGDIGGHFLGFLGAKMSPTNSAILGHGFHGSFHLWNLGGGAGEPSSWSPGCIVGGHFGEVADIGWDPKGEYLISVSADQTSRIHGQYKEVSRLGPLLALHNILNIYYIPFLNQNWYEIARPQVHGYDMQVVAVLDRYRFASGAEEKIVRTFQAPSDFVRSFRSICAVDPETAGDLILHCKSTISMLTLAKM